jgi:hypothetical protein
VLWLLPDECEPDQVPRLVRPIPVHGLWGQFAATRADVKASVEEATSGADPHHPGSSSFSAWESCTADAAEVASRLGKAMEALVAAATEGSTADASAALDDLRAQCCWAEDAGALGGRDAALQVVEGVIAQLRDDGVESRRRATVAATLRLLLTAVSSGLGASDDAE